MSSSRNATDVLVVGGGPAGCAVAIRLAALGHDVTVVDRRRSAEVTADVRPAQPRGGILTPRAHRELSAVGVSTDEVGGHDVLGTKMWYADRSVSVPWPDDDARGAVVDRFALDTALRSRASDVGAHVIGGAVATTHLADRGFVRGARVALPDGAETDLRCRFLVVADGSNSRFGRGLGTTRQRNWPYAVSASVVLRSDRADDPWLDTVLGLPDANDRPVTGHGWVSPLGAERGTVNVGLTILSSYRDVFGVNALKLLDRFVESMAPRWGFDPAAPCSSPMRFRIPVGGSVTPKMGPTFLVVGDAAGMANPFNSHGIGAALMSGRVAADVLDEALTAGGSMALQGYPARLADEVGRYHQVGRLAARFLGRPALLRTALQLGIRSDRAMGAAMRIAANELRDDDRGGAERAYRLASVVARFAPSW